MKITIFVLLGLALCAGAADLRAAPAATADAGATPAATADAANADAATMAIVDEAPVEPSVDDDSGPGGSPTAAPEAPTDDEEEDRGEDFEAEATALEAFKKTHAGEAPVEPITAMLINNDDAADVAAGETAEEVRAMLGYSTLPVYGCSCTREYCVIHHVLALAGNLAYNIRIADSRSCSLGRFCPARHVPPPL